MDIRIVDDEMNDVPCGEVGEIVYRGPGVMQGDWNLPEGTAEAFAGGWFHSGDLVREDEDGSLYVVDRKKDMIISGGENIYCAEVENVLAAHSAIADVAVVAAQHESGARRRSRWRYRATPRPRCPSTRSPTGATRGWPRTRSRPGCSCSTPCPATPRAR